MRADLRDVIRFLARGLPPDEDTQPVDFAVVTNAMKRRAGREVNIPEPPDITREELFAEIDRLLKIEKIAKALISIPMPPHMMSDQTPHYVLIMELYCALDWKKDKNDG